MRTTLRLLLRLVLFVLFYVVVTPIGIVLRLFGFDPLAIKHVRNAQTYWSSRDHKEDSVTSFTKIK